MAKPRAHLYGRVSDPRQVMGAGIDRQMARNPLAEFCGRHGFELAKKVWIDDGVSAFFGLNASPHHQLGKFLAAATERKGVQPGDCLLIENWDRLSRQNPRASLRLVDDLCQLQIHIGRLDNGQLYRWDSDDIGELFGMLVELARGHSESKMKSFRLRDLKRENRQGARETGRQSRQPIPAWLRWVGDRLEPIPERAEVLQLIFRLSAHGHGAGSIVRELEREAIPPFRNATKHGKGKRRKGERWTLVYVQKLLVDRRLLGEYQPHRTIRETGKKPRQEPDGAPIQGYYPVVISQDEWDASRAGQLARRKCTGRPSSRGFSLFQGLLCHPLGGKWHCLERNTQRGPHLLWSRYREIGGDGSSFPLRPFETEILRHLREIDCSSLFDDGQGAQDSFRIAGQLAAIRKELADIQEDIDRNGYSKTLATRARQLEDRVPELEEHLSQAERRASHSLAQTWADQTSILERWETAEDKTALGVRLRQLFLETIEGIWVLVHCFNEKNRIAAVQIWFHGGTQQRTYLLYYRSGYGTVEGTVDGQCWSQSFASLNRPGLESIDLRRPEDAEDMLAVLRQVGLQTE